MENISQKPIMKSSFFYECKCKCIFSYELEVITNYGKS